MVREGVGRDFRSGLRSSPIWCCGSCGSVRLCSCQASHLFQQQEFALTKPEEREPPTRRSPWPRDTNMAATKTGMTAFDSSLREHQDATNESESEGGVIEPVSPRTYSTNRITRKRQRRHSERIRGRESVTASLIPCNLTCLYLFRLVFMAGLAAGSDFLGLFCK